MIGRLTHAVLVVVLVAETGWSQDRLIQLSLEDAVRLATSRNAALRAKEMEYQATRAGEITAGLRPNPTSSYAAEQFGASSIDPQHTVTLGQTIETGGKRTRRVESARAATRVIGYELADVRRQIIFQVRKSFTDALVAQRTLALARESLKTLDELERVQGIRAQRGDISELELTRIQVQRFAFERDAADAAQALRAAKIALRAVAGPDAIADDFEVVGQLSFLDVPINADELHRLALENRPGLRAVEAAREKARADVNLARANAWWDVTPQLEYQRIGNDNTIGFGFSLPLRIFDRNQGEIARTRAEVERAKALQQAAVTQALSEVDTAVSTLLTERQKVQALETVYLPKARQARDTVEYAYRRGGVSLLDFLDAQRTYRETALEHVRSLGNYQSAVDQLETAVGAPVRQ